MNQATAPAPNDLDPLEISAGYGEVGLTGTGEFVIPVLSEELDVRKELVATGAVRLSKVVHETPEIITEELTSENIEIERIPMDLAVDAAPPVRMEGDVMVVSVVEEVLVVTKQLRLKEELRISKRRSISEYRQEVTLRSEELVVERVGGNSLDPTTGS